MVISADAHRILNYDEVCYVLEVQAYVGVPGRGPRFLLWGSKWQKGLPFPSGSQCLTVLIANAPAPDFHATFTNTEVQQVTHFNF